MEASVSREQMTTSKLCQRCSDVFRWKLSSFLRRSSKNPLRLPTLYLVHSTIVAGSFVSRISAETSTCPWMREVLVIFGRCSQLAISADLYATRPHYLYRLREKHQLLGYHFNTFSRIKCLQENFTPKTPIKFLLKYRDNTLKQHYNGSLFYLQTNPSINTSMFSNTHSPRIHSIGQINISSIA
jgi:hypothetical protein